MEEKQLLTQQITEQTEQIQQARQQQAQAEQHLTGLRATEKEQIAKRERAAAKLSRSEERRTALQTEYDKLIAKLWDEYNMTRSDALAQAKPIEDEQRWQNRLTELRNKIRALGTVNLAAIEEYGEVEGRYRFLKVQSDDVERSRTELLGLIRELTAQMRQLFSKALRRSTRISGRFSPSCLSADRKSGADRPGQHPGVGHRDPCSRQAKLSKTFFGAFRRRKGVCRHRHLLCHPQGQALALLYAGRDRSGARRGQRHPLCAVLKTLSDKTQFIAITHRRGTMEEADILRRDYAGEGVFPVCSSWMSQLESRLGIRS